MEFKKGDRVIVKLEDGDYEGIINISYNVFFNVKLLHNGRLIELTSSSIRLDHQYYHNQARYRRLDQLLND